MGSRWRRHQSSKSIIRWQLYDAERSAQIGAFISFAIYNSNKWASEKYLESEHCFVSSSELHNIPGGIVVGCYFGPLQCCAIFKNRAVSTNPASRFINWPRRENSVPQSISFLNISTLENRNLCMRTPTNLMRHASTKISDARKFFANNRRVDVAISKWNI